MKKDIIEQLDPQPPEIIDSFKIGNKQVTLEKENTRHFKWWVKVRVNRPINNYKCECFSTLFFARIYFNKLKRKYKGDMK